MVRVGITGNIGSGKSEAEKILNELGFKTICADKISHELYLDKEVQNLIMEEFQTLDRKEIAKIVFYNSKKKELLEKIIHPRVIKKIEEFFNQYSSEKFVFVFMPLIFEVKLEGLFDKIILITSDENTRLKRILSRDGGDIKLAKAKINSQMKEGEKIKRADIAIENNSTLEDLKAKLIAVLSQ